MAIITAGDNGLGMGGSGDDVITAGPMTYSVQLLGLAGSGIRGTATVTLNGDQLSASADVAGLTPGQTYTVNLLGPVDGTTGLPQPSQAAMAAEPVLLTLTGTADANGLHVEQTGTLSQLPIADGYAVDDLLPLDLRSVAVSSNGVPVASGEIQLAPLTVAVPQEGFPQGVLVGGNGNDHLIAGNGDTMMVGGSGNDVLSSGRGTDVLTGGLGADLFVLSPGHDVIADFNPTAGDRLALPGGLDPATIAATAHDTPNGVVITLPGNSDVTMIGFHDPAAAAGWFGT
jgi:Ca2+-binding RTX toxin-like protein